MSEWKEVALCNIAPLQYGKSLSEPNRRPGPVPVYSSAGITGSHDEAIVVGPSVIVGRKGNVGTVYFASGDSFPIDTAFYTKGSSEVDLRFLYYKLLSLGLSRLSRDSAVPGLRREEYSGLVTTIPSVPTQEAIAEVLGALDDKIAANTKLAQIADELVRADYAGLQSAGHMTIGELVKNRREAAEPSAVQPRTTYVGLEHIPRRSMWMAESGVAESVTSNKSRFADGDILFGKLRPYFHKVVSAAGHGICSTDIIVLQAKRPEFSGFALAALASDDVVAEVTAASEGTRMPRTGWKDLAATEVPWPGEDQALQFSTRVGILRDSVMSHLAESRMLAGLRDTLLPELMSGRLRVKDAEAAASAAGL